MKLNKNKKGIIRRIASKLTLIILFFLIKNRNFLAKMILMLMSLLDKSTKQYTI